MKARADLLQAGHAGALHGLQRETTLIATTLLRDAPIHGRRL
jgi:hypothetical protein